MADQANWITSNTKEAASLNALGFPIVHIDVVEQCVDDNIVGTTSIQMSIGATNVYHPGLALRDVINPWREGTLATENPMHPYLIGLRACNAYDRLQHWIHTGTRYRLRLAAGDRCTVHERGEELASLRAQPMAETDDLRLACALTGLGFPALDLVGSGKYKTIRLPQFGHAIKDADGNWQTPDIVPLVARVPGKRDLLIELTQPLHPIVAAYNAGHVHSQLLSAIKSRSRRRTLAISPETFTGRCAIVSEFATGKVMDNVGRHLGLNT